MGSYGYVEFPEQGYAQLGLNPNEFAFQQQVSGANQGMMQKLEIPYGQVVSAPDQARYGDRNAMIMEQQ